MFFLKDIRLQSKKKIQIPPTPSSQMICICKTLKISPANLLLSKHFENPSRPPFPKGGDGGKIDTKFLDFCYNVLYSYPPPQGGRVGV